MIGLDDDSEKDEIGYESSVGTESQTFMSHILNDKDRNFGRASKSAAEFVLTHFYANDDDLLRCLGILADSIELANSVQESSWGVTLHAREVRLNIGWLQTCVLRPHDLYLVVDGDAYSPKALEDLAQEMGGPWGGRVFSSDPTAFGVHVSEARLTELLPQVLEGHRQYVVKAAGRVRTRCHHYKTHSPGVLTYLRERLGRDIPDPGYAKEDEPLRRYWKISPGLRGKDWDSFRGRGIIATDWAESFNLDQEKPTSLDDLKAKLEQRGVLRAGQIPSGAGQLWQFYYEMEPGDQVCAYAQGVVLGWGEITGDYEFISDDLGYPHRRPVSWRSTTPVATDTLPDDLKKKIVQSRTIVELTATEFHQASGRAVQPLAAVRPVIERSLMSSGLLFSPWQIASFYTALQTKGLVILSGISGTGKSKLAQHFASLLPQPPSDSHSLDLPGMSSGRTEVETPSSQEVEQLARSLVVVPIPQSFERTNRLYIYRPLLKAQPLFTPPTVGEEIELPTEINNQSLITYLTSREHGESDRAVIEWHIPQSIKPLVLEQGDLKDGLVIEPRFDANHHLISIRIVNSREAETPAEEGTPTNEVSKDVEYEEDFPSSRILKGRGNSLFLSVRPDWRDSKDLLGYFNPLTNRYQATPFLHLLLRAIESYQAEDGLAWFVIFDEMNLSHVEYYFADLLSVLESGRDNHGLTREPIRLSYPPEAEGDLPPGELFLPPNLYFVGTVNVDETTQTFSPKVLDRAFAIELIDVDFSDYPISVNALTDDGISASERLQLLAAFTSSGRFARIDKVTIANYIDRRPEVRDRLQLLNERLRPFDLHFGFRVFDEIVMFLHSAAGNGTFEGLGNDAAFDAAVLMKVLPKFHGSRARLERPIESMLGWCIDPDHPDDTMIASALTGRDAEDVSSSLKGISFRCERTANRLQRMVWSLQTEGFASFG